MDERLKLAEAYYMTAQDLERMGRNYLEMAQALNTIADALCERNIKQSAPSDSATQHEAKDNNG